MDLLVSGGFVRIAFSKMHGLGNDFVVIDAIKQKFDLDQERCRAIADRRFGIGCDQILLVETAQQPNADFHYRIFNQDGSEVEQCGNGARCVARFVLTQRLIDAQEIVLSTTAGLIRLFMEADGQIRVNMGTPRLQPQDIPFVAGRARPRYPLAVDGETWEIGAVSMGNPHAVLNVTDVDQAPVRRIGPRIESHLWFPNRVNVGFMQVVTREHIRLRVYERGVGETLACGTGACAAVVVGRYQELLDERVRVSLPGGDLIIQWAEADAPVWMTGPATHVFSGEIEL